MQKASRSQSCQQVPNEIGFTFFGKIARKTLPKSFFLASFFSFSFEMRHEIAKTYMLVKFLEKQEVSKTLGFYFCHFQQAKTVKTSVFIYKNKSE